jgi:catechol 2,3-dioxygenase-like lactoylglutathione lyase family enzyme
VGLTVANLERAATFYEEVLSFRRDGESTLDGPEHARLEGLGGARTRRSRLDLGAECLELSQPVGGVRRPIPADSHSNDRWFQHVAIVVRDMDRAYAWLEAHHVVHASVEPQRLPEWNRAAANIRAYYFQDPDRHTLEVIWFPADKGQARWHAPPGDALFLGIDHTAIAVADTAASESFYAGRLGLQVTGKSENWGPEQERLNNVPGAHLRITSLRAEAGPGVEPRTGRPMPSDERSDDVTHWRTVLLVDRLDGPPRAMRDPDGHAVEMHPWAPSGRDGEREAPPR